MQSFLTRRFGFLMWTSKKTLRYPKYYRPSLQTKFGLLYDHSHLFVGVADTLSSTTGSITHLRSKLVELKKFTAEESAQRDQLRELVRLIREWRSQSVSQVSSTLDWLMPQCRALDEEFAQQITVNPLTFSISVDISWTADRAHRCRVLIHTGEAAFANAAEKLALLDDQVNALTDSVETETVDEIAERADSAGNTAEEVETHWDEGAENLGQVIHEVLTEEESVRELETTKVEPIHEPSYSVSSTGESETYDPETGGSWPGGAKLGSNEEQWQEAVTSRQVEIPEIVAADQEFWTAMYQLSPATQQREIAAAAIRWAAKQNPESLAAKISPLFDQVVKIIGNISAEKVGFVFVRDIPLLVQPPSANQIFALVTGETQYWQSTGNLLGNASDAYGRVMIYRTGLGDDAMKALGFQDLGYNSQGEREWAYKDIDLHLVLANVAQQRDK